MFPKNASSDMHNTAYFNCLMKALRVKEIGDVLVLIVVLDKSNQIDIYTCI